MSMSRSEREDLETMKKAFFKKGGRVNRYREERRTLSRVETKRVERQVNEALRIDDAAQQRQSI